MNEEISNSGRAINSKSTYILGVDLNRRGKDETAFVVLEQFPFDDNTVIVSYIETCNYTNLAETIDRIMILNSYFDFRKIYVDATGMGGGVFDVLNKKLSRGIVEEVIFTRNSKAEMFYNLKLLMQQKRLKFPNYLESTNPYVKKLYFQLLSIRAEFSDDSQSKVPKIFHESTSHDDIVCSLALAALYFEKKYGRRKYHLVSGSNR